MSNPLNNLPLSIQIVIIRAAEKVAHAAYDEGVYTPTDRHAHALSDALVAEDPNFSHRHWERAWAQYKLELDYLRPRRR